MFNPRRVMGATNYAQMLDFTCFRREVSEIGEITSEQSSPALISKPDEEVLNALRARFMKPYAYEKSIELPVKSSASAILKMQPQEMYYAENELFPQESEEGARTGETGAERGIAYRPAGQCGVRMVPFLGYGLGTGR